MFFLHQSPCLKTDSVTGMAGEIGEKSAFHCDISSLVSIWRWPHDFNVYFAISLKGRTRWPFLSLIILNIWSGKFAKRKHFDLELQGSLTLAKSLLSLNFIFMRLFNGRIDHKYLRQSTKMNLDSHEQSILKKQIVMFLAHYCIWNNILFLLHILILGM
jgi:hypothetical protein